MNEYAGDHAVLPDGGYGALLHKLAAGIEVRYNEQVRGLWDEAVGCGLCARGGAGWGSQRTVNVLIAAQRSSPLCFFFYFTRVVPLGLL